MAKHIRIKPYDVKRGQVVRKYTYGPTGIKFEEGKGWYVIDDELADKLRDVQQTGDPMSPLLFDLCTEKEARAIDARERKAKERRDADAPTDMSTKDLRKDLRERPAPTPERTPVDERREARAARIASGRQKGAGQRRAVT